MIKYCRSCKHWIPKDAFCCSYCGAYQKWSFKKLFTFNNLLSIATLIMAISILGQTNILKRSFELENRPYLYVDISPIAFSNREKQPNGNEEYDNLYVGAELLYKNVGKLPACNIKSEIHFYSDIDEGDNFERLKQWYREEFGYFPEPTTIFPHQEGQKIVCRVDCSEGTKNYLFTIRVKYTGEDPKRAYWYAADIRYSIEKNRFMQKLIRLDDGTMQIPPVKNYPVYFIHASSDYDRGGNIKMPEILTRKALFEKMIPSNK